MPIYEFVCQDCGHGFEHLSLGPQPESLECPSCKGHELHRKLSTFAVATGSSSAAPAPAGCGSCAEAGTCAMRGF